MCGDVWWCRGDIQSYLPCPHTRYPRSSSHAVSVAPWYTVYPPSPPVNTRYAWSVCTQTNNHKTTHYSVAVAYQSSFVTNREINMHKFSNTAVDDLKLFLGKFPIWQRGFSKYKGTFQTKTFVNIRYFFKKFSGVDKFPEVHKAPLGLSLHGHEQTQQKFPEDDILIYSFSTHDNSMFFSSVYLCLYLRW